MLKLKLKQWAVLTSSILAGLGMLTGCGSVTPGTNTTNVSSSTVNKGYLSYVPSQYAAAPTETKKWLNSNPATKSVTVTITIPANGLSLNGYYHGFAAIEVPVGWKMTVNLQNHNPDVDGRLAVVTPNDVTRGSNIIPAVPGGEMTNSTSSNGSSGVQTMQFTPTKAGNYLIESVSAGMSGSWLWLIVSPNASQPTVKLKKTQ
ncbi:hypothetical protein AN477_10185 [Alicyclobacillus ferrooxydans]|uniref:Sulfocyanin-like C-terminal domain-containing protein n=1 Tax=Alicyclobacillus ferrooxydans TaxID=471514 RepID=A0A0P9CVL4_9BACL|nr:hypothetical protein AN477_10185 [Alicyclobacillus ferrooxydans]